MVGCCIMIILAGPGGKHAAFGSFAWSTVFHRCSPYGVRIIGCPGMVLLERSALDPPNQTPVMSRWPSNIGGGVAPVYHQAPAFGGSLRVWAAAGVAVEANSTM